MDNALKEIIWRQFGASIDMLGNAIENCPGEYWDTDKKFWYNAYHCLFFLDYYLTLEPVNFRPPAPFSLSEFGEGQPERTYTKAELQTYLHKCREKCRGLIGGMTDTIANGYWVNESKTKRYKMIEILLYNMRHVQHHAAQLNLLLRQGGYEPPRWVSQANTSL